MQTDRWIPARCVTLTPSEQSIVEYVAKSRFEQNRAAGNVNQKAGPQSQFITERNGFGGEFAAAKFFNVFPDCDTTQAVPGPDLTLYGQTVDVKTTDKINYNVFVLALKGGVCAAFSYNDRESDKLVDALPHRPAGL